MSAYESSHEARGRCVVDRSRRADLLDASVVHHHHRIRNRHRFLLRMGHVHEGDPEVALQPELPALISSWPAIILRVDVLPHPDGPSRQQ